MYIGIDIGGTTVKYGLVDERGEVLSRDSIPTNQKKESFIEEIIQIIRNFQAENIEIKGVGISAPGIIKENGYMTTAGAIKSLYGTNLKQELESVFHLPVFVENDANAAAIAEKWIGNAQGIKNYLCIVLGTGMGGGIVINGDIYRGSHGMAGEFGWMVIDDIPQEGNIETASLNQRAAVVSGLCSQYNKMMKQNDSYFEEIHDAQIIFQQEKTNKIAAIVIQRFFQELSIGLINLISCFDPELILIGGGISENNYFFNRLERELAALENRHGSISYLKELPIAPIKQTKLRNDAGMVGAVFQVHQKLKEQNK